MPSSFSKAATQPLQSLGELLKRNPLTIEMDFELVRTVEMNASGKDIHCVCQLVGFYRHFVIEAKAALDRARRRGAGEREAEHFAWALKCRDDFEVRLRQISQSQRIERAG